MKSNLKIEKWTLKIENFNIAKNYLAMKNL